MKQARVQNENLVFLSLVPIAFVTLFFWTPAHDPFNLGKLAGLIMITVPSLAIAFNLKYLDFRPVVRNTYPILIFIAGLTLAFAIDPQEIQRKASGAYFRGDGFLLYLLLALFAVLTFIVLTRRSISKVVTSLTFIASIVAIYGFIQFFKLDWVKWDFSLVGTVYPISTHGNPNFLSSFLGFTSVLFLYQAINKVHVLKRLSAFLAYVALAFLIWKTGSLQGLLVMTVSTTAFFILRLNLLAKASRFLILFGTFFVFMVATILGLASLGRIEFMSFLTQTTLVIREAYWSVAIKMFLNNPFFGVGMDAYGENYVKYRDTIDFEKSQSLSNNAHNVYLQLLSTGGLILFLPYLALTLFVFFRTIKFMRASSLKDEALSLFFSIWLGYLAQSLISIDQVSLAMWNWFLMGLLIHLTKNESTSIFKEKIVRNMNRRSLLSPAILTLSLFIIIHSWIFSFNLLGKNVFFKELRLYSQNLQVGDVAPFSVKQVLDLFEHYKGNADYGRLTTVAAYKLGMMNEADKFSEVLLSLHPQDYEINKMKSQVLQARGKAAEAIQYSEKLTQIDPGDSNAWKFLADNFASINRIDDARKILLEGSQIARDGETLLTAIDSMNYETFKVGDYVTNNLYGIGRIRALENVGDQTFATVEFDGISDKYFKVNIQVLDKYVPKD